MSMAVESTMATLFGSRTLNARRAAEADWRRTFERASVRGHAGAVENF